MRFIRLARHVCAAFAAVFPATVLVTAQSPAPQQRPQPAAGTPGDPASSAFVTTAGKDTISLERYTRAGNTITGTWVFHQTGAQLHDYTITLGFDGMPTRYEMELLTPGVATPPNGLRGVTVLYGRDTATYVIRRDRTDTTRVAMHGAYPLLGFSLVTFELALGRMRAARVDSLTVTMNAPTRLTPPTQVPLRLVGADSALLAGGARARIGADGRILGVRQGTSETVRADGLDLAHVVAGFMATDGPRIAAEAAAIAARVAIALPVASLQRFVGSYDLNPTVALTISRSGDTLFVALGGQTAIPVFAEAPTKFFLKGVNAGLEFELDGTGSPTAVTISQNGARQRAPRAITPPMRRHS